MLNLKQMLTMLIVLGITNTALAAGSNVKGTLQGLVINSNSDPVSDATVTIDDPSVGTSRTLTTDAQGQFSLSTSPGSYVIEASKSGLISAGSETVRVSLGAETNITLLLGMEGQSMEELVVLGSQITPFKSDALTGVSFSSEEIAAIPVARNIEAVSLLAPGTIRGDAAFGDDKTLVSFGGSSVAENVYYINGLNVTNFRNGLGGSSVPFEFYSDFQVKTGGYSAEFGRSTGGVINAVTKHGTNEFEYGVVAYADIGGLRDSSPNTFYADGDIYDDNEDNESSQWTTDVYVAGPIIEDKLFFYALYEFADQSSEFTTRNSTNGRNEEEISDDFYGIDLLWNITDNHTLNLTHFSDERTIETEIYDDYDPDTNQRGSESASTSFEYRGGKNTILRYDGQLTNDFALSLLYGVNEYDLTDTSSALLNCPNVVNSSANVDLPFIAGCAGQFVLADIGGDEREAYRIDGEWNLGNHNIRFGIDNEINTTDLTTSYPAGGSYYRYYTLPVGSVLAGSEGTVVPDVNGDGSDVDFVRYRFLNSGGSFETESSAFYIEDNWQVNDRLEVSLGLRSESFNNKNSAGESFIKLDNQLGPRLGFNYDLSDANAERSVYATWGRYHLPIANNTNARLSGAELFFQTWYLFDGALDPVTDAPASVDPSTGLPTSTQISPQVFFSDGDIPDTRTIVDSTIDPMYQDEFIIGYRQSFGDYWTVGLNYINRELSSTIDDVDVLSIGEYVLTNPGTPITVFAPNEDGDLVETVLGLDEQGAPAGLTMPEAERTYEAIEIDFTRAWDDRWSLKGSYTYSKSEGNTEGLVKSDNGQDDAGLTTDFDFAQLMDGAYGYLANDRRHKLKMWGNYQATENLRLGGVFNMSSGRPINSFGLGHPLGDPAYGQTYYVRDGELGPYNATPRGSQGRTDWVTSIDINAVYSSQMGAADVEFRLDIFNLLNESAGTQVFEDFESGAPGSVDDRWGLIDVYQAPRTVRLGAAFRF